MVVLFLGLVGLTVAVGSLAITAAGCKISTNVLMLGSAAIGSLAALLATTLLSEATTSSQGP
jgi:hypothetical protein